MKDKFFLMHMMPIVRAHIAIFDENGNVKEQLSESREEDLKLYSEIIKNYKLRKTFTTKQEKQKEKKNLYKTITEKLLKLTRLKK